MEIIFIYVFIFSQKPTPVGIHLRNAAQSAVQPTILTVGEPEGRSFPVCPKRGCGPVVGFSQEQREHDVRETQPSNEVRELLLPDTSTS